MCVCVYIYVYICIYIYIYIYIYIMYMYTHTSSIQPLLLHDMICVHTVYILTHPHRKKRGIRLGQGSLGPHFFGDLLSQRHAFLRFAMPRHRARGSKQSSVQFMGMAGNDCCETIVIYGQCLSIIIQ